MTTNVELASLYTLAEEFAEETFGAGAGKDRTLAESTNRWFCAEIAFQSAVGCGFLVAQKYPLLEPYQINLAYALATTLRAARVAKFNQEFSPLVAA